MQDTIHEECGVFGIFGARDNAAERVLWGLAALQHRGQEGCGIAVCDRGVITCRKAPGLVLEQFDRGAIESLGPGSMAVGHVRYSTCGGNDAANLQPLSLRHIKGNMALVHNGNLVNASALRESFELGGAIFRGSSDTEAIAYAIVRERLITSSTEEAIAAAMSSLRGAYSCIAMTATKLIAFRDRDGFRPLCIGRTEDGAVVIASESCALDAAGAQFIRDIEPGEVVTVSAGGISSIRTAPEHPRHICIFEYIYFARPDSVIEGISVHEARIKAGRILAKTAPADADIVIGVPDSGLDGAMGYALESGIPYGMGFVKNKYVGRSFIEPSQDMRENAVRIKLGVIGPTVRGKRVVLIDDSIVRGTTSGRIVRLLRNAGAKEVHLRVTAPPFKHSCYFGTDIDGEDDLIASRLHSPEAIAQAIGADSLGFFPAEQLGELCGGKGCCGGCFTGEYPVDVTMAGRKNKFDSPLSTD